MNPVETYITTLRDARATGSAVEETSHYVALATLLNEVGKTLKPRVTCVINLSNRGAGLPDGGFFTPDQMRRAKESDSLFSQVPARGSMEVKGPGDDVAQVARSEQVRRYAEEYGLVLVTTYRDFLLVSREPGGEVRELERYTLAESADEFWREAAHPRRMADRHGERLTQYLMRVLLHEAPLVQPRDVAWLLASHARDAKARIDSAEDLAALDAVRTALEEALGLKFEAEKGEHFFRSTLVQTLFYGLFSAWVLWSKQRGRGDSDRFDWRTAGWSLHVPMIRALYEQISTPSQLGRFGLDEVMSWAGEALNRVAPDEFFARFEESQAVQYFYEPFLEAFDPELRKELGVWYTPPEIVKYMVARVDTALREELGIRDGLADPNVYVLDPCCGTGAYLVEVLRQIEDTLRHERGDDALIPGDVKKAAKERVFGFELLPAPFVIAHLQLGLLLRNLGAPLSDENERAGVYLTNALTGWEPPREAQGRLLFPELQEEREAAEDVKREKPILVILGNPPYNAFAGVSPKEEQGLVEPYKDGLISRWGIKKFNLDDLYVRFFRLAERRIAEVTGRGVVCYISNYSWLTGPSFVVLRQHLLQSFDKFWIENMHGDRKISEYAPDGRTSETVFAIKGFSPGIQQGVAVSTWVRSGERPVEQRVLFRDDLSAARATERRAELLQSLELRDFDSAYERAVPCESNRFSFRPQGVLAAYLDWPTVVDLSATKPSNGLMEKRGGSLIDVDKDKLAQRMSAYFDPGLDWQEYGVLGYGLEDKRAAFLPKACRERALASERFSPERIVRYKLRPFDVRWCYYTSVPGVWNRCRPSLWSQNWSGNSFLLARFKASKRPEGPPLAYTTCLCDDHALSPDAVAVPLRVKNGARLSRSNHASLFAAVGEEIAGEGALANLSARARAYLSNLGMPNPDGSADTACLVWMHALAVGYSPAYLAENADGIRQDWPRIPLPDSNDALLASAHLGKQLAALLDTEQHVEGVTCGAIRSELKGIAVTSTTDGRPIDLAVTAGWGHAGKDGVTMPGKGKLVERKHDPGDGLGSSEFDVYLNDKAYWKGIPKRVWDYHIGGYQVIKKWLSYRERDLLGRPLTSDEVREVTNMARRIAAIILLEPELDANYERAKSSSYPWPST